MTPLKMKLKHDSIVVEVSAPPMSVPFVDFLLNGFEAWLTPREAEAIARALIKAADVVRAKKKAKRRRPRRGVV